MACGGCAKRAAALRGLAQNRPTVQKASNRIAVVTQHAMRSALQTARSTLPSTVAPKKAK